MLAVRGCVFGRAGNGGGGQGCGVFGFRCSIDGGDCHGCGGDGDDNSDGGGVNSPIVSYQESAFIVFHPAVLYDLRLKILSHRSRSRNRRNLAKITGMKTISHNQVHDMNY